jgi:hypothetical protein
MQCVGSDSSIGVVTRCGLDGAGIARVFAVKTGLRAHLAFYVLWAPGLFPGVKAGEA